MIRAIDCSRLLAARDFLFAQRRLVLRERELIERAYETTFLFQLLNEDGPFYREYLRQVQSATSTVRSRDGR